MYLIYGKDDGKVWREVHQYEILDNGDIHAGINGVNTLTYPVAVNVDIIEISDNVWNTMDQNHPNKYIIKNGNVVEDPDYSEPNIDDIR